MVGYLVLLGIDSATAVKNLLYCRGFASDTAVVKYRLLLQFDNCWFSSLFYCGLIDVVVI